MVGGQNSGARSQKLQEANPSGGKIKIHGFNRVQMVRLATIDKAGNAQTHSATPEL
jgi:hypothetical protein